jgi:hypothetical protein
VLRAAIVDRPANRGVSVSESSAENAPFQRPEDAETAVEESPGASPATELRPLIAAHRRRPMQLAVLGTVVAVAAIVVAIASARPHARYEGPVQATPAGADGRTTYKAAHFAARFPSTPFEDEVPGSFGGSRFTLRLAIVRTPHLLEVAENEIEPALPQSTVDSNLRATLTSLASSSGMTLDSQQATTFQGQPARRGSLASPTGQTFDAIAAMYNRGREYLLLAPTGAAFDDLVASFEALP